MRFTSRNSRVARWEPAQPPEPARQAVASRPQPAAGDLEPLSITQMFRPLSRHWIAIVMLTVFSTLVGLLAGLRQPPIYRATAQLDVEGLNNDFLKSPGPIAHDDSVDSYVQMQMKILQSPEIMRRVAAKLDLEHSDEYQPSHGLLSSRSAPAGLAPTGSASGGSEEQRLRDLSQRVTVRTAGQTRLVEITAESQDPQLAADLANTFAQEYIELGAAIHAGNANDLMQSLSSQVLDLKANLERSENTLQAYAGQSRLLDLSATDPNSVAESSVRLAQESHSKAREERISAESRYQRVLSSPAETLPEVMDDPTLRSYYEKLTDMKRQDAELSATLKPTHYSVQQVRAQIAVLEAAIEKGKDGIVKRMKNQYEAARDREQMEARAQTTETDLASQQAAKSVHYNTLKQEVDTNRQLYEAMSQKVKEAGIAGAIRATNAQILSAASAPESPAKPVLALYGICGGVAGALLGVMIAFLRSAPRASLRKPGDANVWLGIRELAVLPHTPCLLQTDGEVGSQDWDRLADICRATVASVMLSAPRGEHPRVIAITSTQPREGKTTVASNFAIALAETNQRVLLIDANLSNPRLHTIFGALNTTGFASLLEHIGLHSRHPVAEFCTPTTVPGLFLMPAGASGRSVASRLYSPRLPLLLESMRREFDSIVIDAAPLSSLDSRPLARAADGVVVVIGTRTVSPAEAKAAMERLADDGAVVLGAVMNNFDPRKLPVPERKALLSPAREQSYETV
jgi:polysaccharide biosynthesis transport protein